MRGDTSPRAPPSQAPDGNSVRCAKKRSCAIDDDRLQAADISEYEQIQIHNVNNGERFTTYAIRAEQGLGIISENGAAARRAAPGDILIIASYSGHDEAELKAFEPSLVHVDAGNRIKRQRNRIPVPLA
jgi:aspartate 1-decarboxylase